MKWNIGRMVIVHPRFYCYKKNDLRTKINDHARGGCAFGAFLIYEGGCINNHKLKNRKYF